MDQLAHYLQQQKYSFTTVTPETHRRILERDGDSFLTSLELTPIKALQALFGWNKKVPENCVDGRVRDWVLELGGTLQNGLLHSPLRFSTLDSLLFVHSGYPTNKQDAVFFGPDSYRFLRYVKEKVKITTQQIVDLGCGTGVGGLVLAKHLIKQEAPFLKKVILVDINDRALFYSQMNYRFAKKALTDISVEVLKSDLLASISLGADVIIANPPFLLDPQERVYRSGGGSFGEGLSLRIVEDSLKYLRAGGQLILYTGSCIVQGQDLLKKQVEELARVARAEIEYQEIDPDIFGEELSSEIYRGRGVERIAAVGLTLWR